MAKTEIKIPDLGLFLGIDERTIKAIRADGSKGAYIEVDCYVLDSNGKRVTTHRKESVVNTYRIALI